MTLAELIELTKEMPKDAQLIWSASFYNDLGSYKGSAYVEVEKVQHYDQAETIKDKIYLS